MRILVLVICFRQQHIHGVVLSVWQQHRKGVNYLSLYKVTEKKIDKCIKRCVVVIIYERAWDSSSMPPLFFFMFCDFGALNENVLVKPKHNLPLFGDNKFACANVAAQTLQR